MHMKRNGIDASLDFMVPLRRMGTIIVLDAS